MKVLANFRLVMLLVWVMPIAAEQGILVVHVEDLHSHPIAGVRLRAGGDSSIETADASGAARIRLAAQTKPGAVAMLEVVASPKGKDLVMISPLEKWTLVPPFENDAKNFVPIILIERGDKECLENAICMRAATGQVVKAGAPVAVTEQPSEERFNQARRTVAERFGLEPEALDQAIRAWGTKTEDPFDKGLANLYEHRYPEATARLSASLEQRKRDEAKAQSNVVEAAFFLGQSLYHQGKYREAAQAYQEASNRRPDDGALLNHLALSWGQAGEYAKALPIFQRTLAISESVLGSEDPYVAMIMSNLACFLHKSGDNKQAGVLFGRALAIAERQLDPNDARLAVILDNFSLFRLDQEDYTNGEAFQRRALAIDEKALGPDDPNTAISLSNLGSLLTDEGRYGEAESLIRRAVAILEKKLGNQHPETGTAIHNLALLLKLKGELVEAEQRYRRALAIQEATLGPNSIPVATDLNNLASLLHDEGKYAQAEPLYRRALEIEEKAGSPPRNIVKVLSNLALLLGDKGDYDGARSEYTRALTISQQALGPDALITRQLRDSLESLPKKQ